MRKDVKLNLGESGRLVSADDQPIADGSPENTPAPSLRSVSQTVPPTQPAIGAMPKPKVDRSQFISKTKPVAAPSGSKQTKFPLRKPGGKLYFRATSDSNTCMLADVIEGNMGKAYVVGVDVTRDAALERLISQAWLVPCVNERGQAFVWFIKTSSREWSRSALEMVEEAKGQWILIEADSFAQAYKFEDAMAYPELYKSNPNWPASPSDILDEALTSSAITHDDDPLLLDFLGKRRSRQTA